MSIAIEPSIHRDPVLDAVEQQSARLARAERRTLVCCCVEQRGQSWARRLDDVAYVSSELVDLDEGGVLESLCAAVQTFGIEELVLVAHTGCSGASNSREADSGPVSFDPRKLLSTYGSDLEQRKKDVRAAVQRLRSELGKEIQLSGAVELGSSGQLLGYLEDEDAFRRVG